MSVVRVCFVFGVCMSACMCVLGVCFGEVRVGVVLRVCVFVCVPAK